MEIKKLNEEINELSDRLAFLTSNFGRTFSLVTANEISETRRILREKKTDLNRIETVKSFKQ